MSLFLWSQTPSNNATADPSINWAEGQTPGSVNNSARQMMASIAEWRDDISGSLVLAGGTTAYTLSTNQTFTSLTDGLMVVFEVNATNTDAVTLNVDSLGAKSLITSTGNALTAGILVAGGKYSACFDSSADAWILLSYNATQEEFASGTSMLFAQTSAPTGWTKDTNYDEHALRVVSGSASSGGTIDFTTAFTSKSVSGTVGDTTLTIAQMPLHGHPYRCATSSASEVDSNGGLALNNSGDSNRSAFTGTPSTSGNEQIGGEGGGQSHTHSFSGTAIDLSVKYLDVILASKD